MLELIRLVPNEERATAVQGRLAAFAAIPMPAAIWPRAREIQLLLARDSTHRRVPPGDLLIAATAELAGVPLVHYDRDYERIARVAALEHRWFVPDGTLAPDG